METGKEADVASYPTPDELWYWCFGKANQWRDNFASIPFKTTRGSTVARYYQEIAVNRALDAIAGGKKPHPAYVGDWHRKDIHRVPDRLEAIP